MRRPSASWSIGERGLFININAQWGFLALSDPQPDDAISTLLVNHNEVGAGRI
jgi:hypothetical protein